MENAKEKPKQMIEPRCIRCGNEMKELPTPPDQAGMGTTIKVYACTKCGKMEFFMEVLKDGNNTN